MNTIDLPSKKKQILRFISLVVVSSIMVISCYVYHRNDTYKSIKVVVNKNAAVEYGSANYDINKLIKKVEGEIVSVKQDIDTKQVGEQEVVVEVKKEDIVKDVSFLVNVVDTTAPVVKIKEEKVTITEGDDYDLTTNIESVTDEVDGDIAYSNDVQEESNFYYNFSYGADIDDVGSHEVVVNAEDKNGNVTQTKFTVEVKAKPVYTPSTPVYSNAPASAVGGDVVSIAYSLVGSPYISGSNGPYGFDCSGFVQYVYSRVGKSVSRSSYTQAYDGVGVSYANAQPGDILNWGHGGAVTHSALYVGNGLMIHATNPSQGVVVSSVSGWQNGSIDNLMGVRRVN
ncbi:MAG: C40 family peptidase [Bacilli bacterium]|nr:C40 family peptidase [Bacilli bacterium]